MAALGRAFLRAQAVCQSSGVFQCLWKGSRAPHPTGCSQQRASQSGFGELVSHIFKGEHVDKHQYSVVIFATIDHALSLSNFSLKKTTPSVG